MQAHSDPNCNCPNLAPLGTAFMLSDPRFPVFALPVFARFYPLSVKSGQPQSDPVTSFYVSC